MIKPEFFLADTTAKQLKIKKDFQGLFQESFDMSMSDYQWEHFYLKAPFGQTISFVYYFDNTMVAHGGLVPQQLISENGETFDYFLQTAVMVKKGYKNLALFKELMDSIGTYINNCKSFTIAFPNKQTYLPFVKMLGWKMVREYSIGQYELKEGYLEDMQKYDKGDFQYEIYKNEAFMNWRRELNGFKLLREDKFELIYKDYEGSFEILDISLKDKGFSIPIGDIMRKFEYQRANIPQCFSHYIFFKDLFFTKTIGIPQRMCFYPLLHKRCKYEEIKPSLLLSDVF